MSSSFVFKANAKCDKCLKVFKLVSCLEGGELLCQDCLAKRLESKYGINPKDVEMDEKSKKVMDEAVDKIVKEIKKENE